jgi:alkylation response protein AidB-like acyl-CoA dehydrogenase
MDFELTEDQQALRTAAKALLERECRPAVARRIFEGETAQPDLWRRMADLDWPALAVPVEMGGVGLGFVETAIVVEELGRAVAPVPFLSTATQFLPMVLASPTAAEHKGLVARIVADGRTATVALAEADGRWDLDSIACEAHHTSDGGWVLNGRKAYVMDGAASEYIAVVAAAEEGLGVFVIDGDQARFESRPLLDPTQPLDDVVLEDTQVGAERVLIEPGHPGSVAAIEEALQQSTAALAVGITGTCRTIFETTLQYAKDREQFGRPIGSFQAVKHRLVDMYLALERASSLAYFAALTIAENDSRRAVAASMAKAAAGDCQRLMVREGLQLHGGIGYMWEQDLHMYMKRAKSQDLLFGSSRSHRAFVAGRLGL